MRDCRLPAHVLCDMDGVLIQDDAPIPGAREFISHLKATERTYLIVTNNSLYSPGELHVRLASMGLEIPESRFWTSAMATARFAQTQFPGGTAYVIGERSLHEAVRDVGYAEDSRNPDFVILGETWTYSFSDFSTALRLLKAGSRFIATNPETSGLTARGALPGCGAVAALLEVASGVSPFFIGKPNPLMLHEAVRALGATNQQTLFIGDRMDTDVLAGLQAGIPTALALSGVATREDANRYPFRPDFVIGSVADFLV